VKSHDEDDLQRAIRESMSGAGAGMFSV